MNSDHVSHRTHAIYFNQGYNIKASGDYVRAFDFG
jgi:hypothetical protein